jgi:uncharacterized tellurite resistance protein B-like protein
VVRSCVRAFVKSFPECGRRLSAPIPETLTKTLLWAHSVRPYTQPSDLAPKERQEHCLLCASVVKFSYFCLCGYQCYSINVMSLLRFLGLDQQTDSGSASSDTETLRKITQALNEMDPKQAGYIATFAYILGRVAHADMEISPEETEEMERKVMELGHLPEEQAIIVVQIAKTQNVLFGGTENFLVTREFNKTATREQKITLLHCLFAVSSTDEDISSSENREIRQIVSELKLEHKDFIAVRSEYRHHLSVLKKPEDE